MTSWWLQNMLVLLLLAGFGVFCWHCSKREHWRQATRELKHRKGAVVCFFILCGYLAIGLLDSVGWRQPALNPETGQILRDQQGKIVYDGGHSALDYLLTTVREQRETTYSSPLAEYELGEGRLEISHGTGKRVKVPLKYPRSHLLGTDRVGEDVLYQAIKSIRTGLIIGVLTTLLAVPFALVLGVCSGYYGGWVDDALQYVCVVLSSVPTVLFIAAFMLIFGQGLPQLCFAMGIASWTGLYRLLRAETLRLREREYVQAAVALGTSSVGIICRHIIPNVLHLVLITAVLRFSSEVLAEAALTYLGIGVGADTMSWGAMINDARTELTRDPVVWWKLVSAFVFMLGLVLPANMFGDAVRDALDPRLRTQ